MPRAYVAGDSLLYQMDMQGILKDLDYAYYLPEHDGTSGDFIDTLAAMDNSDLLIATPENQFEIGYMLGLHKTIVVHDTRGFRGPIGDWNINHIAIVTEDQVALREVLKELRPVVGGAHPPNEEYLEVITKLRAKYRR
jgi:hypothetical protein